MNFELKKFVEIERVKHDIKSDAEIARRCGWQPAAFSKRMKNPDTTKLGDIEKIADIMDCDLEIKFIDRKQTSLLFAYTRKKKALLNGRFFR